MRIDRNNYEEFAMDYLEGNLTGNTLRSFQEFLRENPDIAAEITGLEEIDLSGTEPIGESRATQLKVSDGRDWDEAIIELVEGVLPEYKEKVLLEEIEQSPALKADLELYRRTRLKPDTSLTYPHKNSLYKEGKVIGFYPQLFRWTAAAAVLALAIWWFNIPPEARYHPGNPNSIAEEKLPEVPSIEKPGNIPVPSSDMDEGKLQQEPEQTPRDGLIAEDRPGSQNQSKEGRRVNARKGEIVSPKRRDDAVEISQIASLEPKRLNAPEPSLEVAGAKGSIEEPSWVNFASSGTSSQQQFQSIPEWLAQRGKEIMDRNQKEKPQKAEDQFFGVKKETQRKRQTVSVKLGFIEVEHSSLQ